MKFTASPFKTPASFTLRGRFCACVVFCYTVCHGTRQNVRVNRFGSHDHRWSPHMPNWDALPNEVQRMIMSKRMQKMKWSRYYNNGDYLWIRRFWVFRFKRSYTRGIRVDQPKVWERITRSTLSMKGLKQLCEKHGLCTRSRSKSLLFDRLEELQTRMLRELRQSTSQPHFWGCDTE